MINICFFGHRDLTIKNLRERLSEVIVFYAEKNKIINCFIGTHGGFDKLELSVCRELRNKYKNIKIKVVFTSLNYLSKGKNREYSIADSYQDVETMIYDIEEIYFKNRITISNRCMVDDSDIIICCVDMREKNSGANKAVKYGIKEGKKIINLFRDQDRPFYGMSEEEKQKAWIDFIRKE